VRFAHIIAHRLRSWFRRSRVEADLQRELDLHLEQLTKYYLTEGRSEADAGAAAHRDFGSMAWTKEHCRDAHRVGLLEDFVTDLAYAVRVLKRSPGFALTAIATLALGIGANTAIFTVVNALLLRPLPFDRPDRLVTLFERNVIGDEQQMAVAPGNLLNWQASSTAFESISGYTTRAVTLTGDNGGGFEPQRLVACACSGNLTSTLGVRPLVGRRFGPDEDRYGASPLVAISYDLWQRQFAGDPDLIGKRIRLDDEPFEVIAIMPRTFAFPRRGVDLWLPLLTAIPPPIQQRHDLHFLQVVARMRSDVTLAQAVADVDRISAAYKLAHPDESTGKGARAIPLHEALVGDVRAPLLVLLAAVTCVLLIACVNLANLQLTRAVARGREIGIRTALGAGPGRLVRQLLTETMLLGVAGGALGLAIALWLARILVVHAPGAELVLPAGTIPLDPIVFAFAFAVAIATGLIVGLLPALRSRRAEVATELRETTRSTTAGRAHHRLRSLLVSGEVALSLVLLVAAGLLLHSLTRLYSVQPGIPLDHALTMGISLPAVRYPTPIKRAAALAELGDRFRQVPGVTAVGLTSCTPLTGSCNTLFFYIEGRPYVPGRFFAAEERSVDPAYFRAAGVRLLTGRTFMREDGVGFDAAHPRVGKLVISEAMAKTFFAGADPIGQRIFFDFELQRERDQGIPAPRYEVIGVVSDVLPTLESHVTPTLYRPLLDVANSGASILVRAAVEPVSVLPALRQEIHQLDAGLVVAQPRTLEEVIGRSTSERRFTMGLFVAFAALALLLAAIGLYGVVAYGVTQRTAEIGVRIALGATRRDVSRLVVMQGLKPALVGVGVGIIGATASAQLLRSLLFGVTPVDPLTFAVVPPALLVVAALACYLPAVRAIRLDPTTALRAE
jgi:predicted permease